MFEVVILSDDDYKYPEKPIAYLDQNILDLFVEDEFKEFLQYLRSNFIVVYSDETLKEVQRSGKGASKFITVLKELDAHHIKLHLEPPEFIDNGRATITSREPLEAFQEYCENTKEFDETASVMEEWLFKFSGGKTGVGISEIHSKQKTAFSNLMDNLELQLQKIYDENKEFEVLFEKYKDEATSQLEGSLDELEKTLKENISDDENWSGIKDFRNATGVGPKQLNNLSPPNILYQIWKIYKDSPPYNNMGIGIEDFYGLKKNPIYPDRPYFKHQKVTGIYNMLNTLGYWPDSKMHKERRFVAAQSDNSHASLASFCHVLFSRDEAFVKKVKATYEHLEIPTVVKLVSIEKADAES